MTIDANLIKGMEYGFGLGMFLGGAIGLAMGIFATGK